MYDFQQFGTIRSFDDSIYTSKISINEAKMDQKNLSDNIADFSEKSKPKSREESNKKQNTSDSVSGLYEGRGLTYNAYRSGVF